MFVDVIDNRYACSTRDDAERYTYEFWDSEIRRLISLLRSMPRSTCTSAGSCKTPRRRKPRPPTHTDSAVTIRHNLRERSGRATT